MAVPRVRFSILTSWTDSLRFLLARPDCPAKPCLTRSISRENAASPFNYPIVSRFFQRTVKRLSLRGSLSSPRVSMLSLPCSRALFLLSISANVARIDNSTSSLENLFRAQLFNLESGIPIRAGPVNVLRPFTPTQTCPLKTIF